MINMLICGNEGVFDGMILCTLSLAKTTKSPIRLYVGTMSLTDIDPRYTAITALEAELLERILRSGNPQNRVILWDVGEQFRSELLNSRNMKSVYTPYAMIRLFADGIEDAPEKLIYTDTDVVFTSDAEELYSIDVNNYHLAGARDYYGKVFISPNYLNSGVMVWNMEKMKEDGVFAACRSLCARKKMVLADQSALNKCAKRKLIISPRFNEQHKTRPDTVARHFSNVVCWLPFPHPVSRKPWRPERLKPHELRLHGELISEWKKIKENGYIYE